MKIDELKKLAEALLAIGYEIKKLEDLENPNSARSNSSKDILLRISPETLK